MQSPYLTNLETQQQTIPSTIQNLHSKLLESIQQIHQKVQHVMTKHQSEFMFAYRNHITKIKRELAEIKKKSEEQERMFSANDRVKFLEKEVCLFRDESIRMYDRLDKANQEMEMYKKKYEQILVDCHHSQRTAKDSFRLSKNAEAEKAGYEIRIKQLQDQLSLKDKQIDDLNNKRNLIESRLMNNSNSFKIGRSQKSRYDSKGKSCLFYNSGHKTMKISENLQLMTDSQFKEIFLECLKKVKKEIAIRKGVQKTDIWNSISFQQFREIDKLKVLQLFFSQPKLQKQLYQKMFPNTLIEKIDIKSNLLEKLNYPVSSTNAIPYYVKQSHKRSISKMQKNTSFL